MSSEKADIFKQGRAPVLQQVRVCKRDALNGAVLISCLDCHGTGTFEGVALNVPAMGMPIPEHDPIRIVFKMGFCGLHLVAVTAEDLLPEGGGLQEIVRAQASGRAEPDFARAFLTVLAYFENAH